MTFSDPDASGAVALAGKKKQAAPGVSERTLARAQRRHRHDQGTTSMSNTSLTPDQLEAQIELQREQLADTVDQLARKLDVKAQAKARLQSARYQLRPEAVAAFVGAAILVGGLVWWRRSR